MVNLSVQDLKTLAYSLTSCDEKGVPDTLLDRKLKRAKYTLSQYLDICKQEPQFRDEVIQLAMDRYLLPNFGLLMKTLFLEAKGGSVNSTKQILDLMASLSKLLRSTRGGTGKSESHLHFHSQLSEQSLLDEAQKEMKALQNIMSKLPANTPAVEIAEPATIIEQIKEQNILGIKADGTKTKRRNL